MEAQLAEFAALYRRHCEQLSELVVSEYFDAVGKLWLDFYGGLSAELVAYLNAPEGIEEITQIDRTVYNELVATIVPDVFQCLSATLTKQIRAFAKQLEGAMLAALPEERFSPALRESKLAAVVQLSQKLRRYTGLNHLAQASRAVLTNPGHVSQMLSDYGRIDFNSIQEQVQSLCDGCDGSLMKRLEGRFKEFHTTSNTLEEWAKWLQEVVRESLGPFEGAADFDARCSELLLRWSFVSSLVIRDLTLRSASSFGMFHLMRLLCDEYMFFLVEQATITKQCPVITHVEGGGVEVKAKSELTGNPLLAPFAASAASATTTTDQPMAAHAVSGDKRTHEADVDLPNKRTRSEGAPSA